MNLSAPDPKLAPCRLTFDNLEIQPGLVLTECEASIDIDHRGEWYISDVRAINTGADWDLQGDLFQRAIHALEKDRGAVDRIECACAEAAVAGG
jgi:hypothetical protein